MKRVVTCPECTQSQCLAACSLYCFFQWWPSSWCRLASWLVRVISSSPRTICPSPSLGWWPLVLATFPIQSKTDVAPRAVRCTPKPYTVTRDSAAAVGFNWTVWSRISSTPFTAINTNLRPSTTFLSKSCGTHFLKMGIAQNIPRPQGKGQNTWKCPRSAFQKENCKRINAAFKVVPILAF